jgi:outer membrane protein TolC
MSSPAGMSNEVSKTAPPRRRTVKAGLSHGFKLACAALVLAWAPAARAQILTLEEVELRAQRPRPELTERQAGIDRAAAEVRATQAKSGPTFGAHLDAGLSPGSRLITIEDVSGERYLTSGAREFGEPGALLPQARYAALLGAHVTLLDFGRTALGVRAAESALGAERATLLQAKVELAQSSRNAYVTWLEAHQTWQLAERDAEVTRARSVSVKELIDAGARPATDATLSHYDEQLAALHQHRAKSAVDAALLALGATLQAELPSSSVPDLDVLGPAPDTSSDANPPAQQPAAPPGRPNTSALDTLEQQRQAALSAASAADRAAAPALDLSAEAGLQGQTTHLFPLYKAAVSFSIPIWDGGLTSAEAEVHRAEARGLAARLEAGQRRLRAEQAVARGRFFTASEELKLSAQLLATAQLLLSQAEDHYRSGSDTLERVLNAQHSLVQARREVLTAQLETARARLDLTPVHIQP